MDYRKSLDSLHLLIMQVHSPQTVTSAVVLLYISNWCDIHQVAKVIHKNRWDNRGIRIQNIVYFIPLLMGIYNMW